jgi:hypothetical protein
MTKQLGLIPLINYHEDLPRIVEKIEIFQDSYFDYNPRQWNNLGEMVIRKVMDFGGDRTVSDSEMRSLVDRLRGLPDWESGDYPEYDELVERYENADISEDIYRAEGQKLLNKYKKEPLVWLPVYALIHSGIWLSTTKNFNGYTCKWDTSFAGVIYAEDEAIIKEFGDLSVRSRGKAIAAFESEIKTYEQFIQGDVYGFSTLDTDGAAIESCGGFFGSDPFKNGMSEHIDVQYHGLLKAAAENIKYE